MLNLIKTIDLSIPVNNTDNNELEEQLGNLTVNSNNSDIYLQMFRFDLIDKDNNQIEAIFFKEFQKYLEIIKEGSIYRISGGQIKINDKRFSNI